MIRWYVKQAAKATGYACCSILVLFLLLVAFERLR